MLAPRDGDGEAIILGCGVEEEGGFASDAWLPNSFGLLGIPVCVGLDVGCERNKRDRWR